MLAAGGSGSASGGARETRAVMTVTGLVQEGVEGPIDAHGHVWISPASPDMHPRLDDYLGIGNELLRYRRRGGAGVVDCQPGGAGRDAKKLRSLALLSGLSIVACTGFHLKRYYPPDSWIWTAPIEDVISHMLDEMTHGMCDEKAEEASSEPRPRPGMIKAAHPGHFRDPDVCRLFDASIAACNETGVALAIHTERGQGVEQLVRYLETRHVDSSRVILCHLDKRPDLSLHRSLAMQGFLLEYDTFSVPKYRPDDFVWPLLEQMLSDGFSRSIACGLDLADSSRWGFSSGEGLCELTDKIIPRLQSIGSAPSVVTALTGKNIWSRLSVPTERVRR
jgi:5-phospho-D-xylono-1,4-lactonase